LIRIFLDSNVLFTAAHNPEGKASLAIELCAGSDWEVVTSAYCLAEARWNLVGGCDQRVLPGRGAVEPGKEAS